MFREKKNIKNNDLISAKKSIIFINTESSTDECSNHKYQLKQKISPNMVILRNKTLLNYIPSIESAAKKNHDYKKDILIKEIINNDEIVPQNNNKFHSLFDLVDNENDMESKNKENNTKFNMSSLVSKNTLKKNSFSRKEKSLDDFIKNNIMKKNHRKNSLNINKLKIYNSIYGNSTPKKDILQRLNLSKKKLFNSKEKYLSDLELNFTLSNSLYHNLSKCQKTYNNSSVDKEKEKKLKEKKFETLIQIMKKNKNSSLNLNNMSLRKGNNYHSLLSNYSNKYKKNLTLQHNIFFNEIINSASNNKYKKKFILKLKSSNKEKTYFDINDSENDHEEYIKNNSLKYLNCIKFNYRNSSQKYRSSKKANIYRKSLSALNDFNISTELSSTEKHNNSKTISKNKMNCISLNTSKINNNNNNEQYKNCLNNIKVYKRKMNSKNYKELLFDVQKRMSFLVNNLINYIELLKNGK